MVTLHAFLDQVATAGPAKVVPRWVELFENYSCVFVGFGKSLDPQARPRSSNLVLNNKDDSHFHRKYSSLTKLLEAPPTGLLESWAIWDGRPLGPAEALRRITFVVEDASPDSIFAILLLLMRLADLECKHVPREWIEAADEWERTGVTDEPLRSWCALQSALAHAHFPLGSEPSSTALTAAWTDGLHFTAACLASNVSPNAVPDLASVKEWRDARSALHQEERVYLDWLQQAMIAQLSLPLKFFPDRRMLLDSLLIVEDQPTGSAKIFYRNDKVRSPLQEGFNFASHYRPAGKGTGNEFTIAVDPRVGVSLRDLWNELERRESEAWSKSGDARPEDEPRWPGRCRWNEPWYINDDETLIGSPERTHLGATKLSWNDVLAAIWCVYHPLLGVEVFQLGIDCPIQILHLTAENATSSRADSDGFHA
jgi:hypothetical protein